MGFLDRFRTRRPHGSYSPEEAVAELERRVSQKRPDPAWASQFGDPDTAKGFLAYQEAMGLVVSLLESDSYAAAMAVIEHLEQGAYPLVTSHARGAHAKACALLGLQRNEEAITYFDSCIGHHPSEIPEAPLNRALALANLGRYAEALADCELAARGVGIAEKAAAREGHVFQQIIDRTPATEAWEVCWLECGHWIKSHASHTQGSRHSLPDVEAAFGGADKVRAHCCPRCGTPFTRFTFLPLMCSGRVEPVFEPLRSAAFLAPFGVLIGFEECQQEGWLEAAWAAKEAAGGAPG